MRHENIQTGKKLRNFFLLQFNSTRALVEIKWSLVCQGHRDNSICVTEPDTTEQSSNDAQWSWRRPTVNVVAARTRAKTIGWATRRTARDQDGWDQLNQTAFVTNPLFPLSLRGSVLRSRRRTCVYARSRSLLRHARLVRNSLYVGWANRLSLSFFPFRDSSGFPAADTRD